MAHVVIGKCPSCGHALKTKEHAPRQRMHVTCHCGWHGDVQVDDALVAHATALRAQGAGHRPRKSPWQRFVRRLTGWWKFAAMRRQH